jgi:hypothetical protein
MRTSTEGDQWLSAAHQAKKELMQGVREAILAADARVTETIKVEVADL